MTQGGFSGETLVERSQVAGVAADVGHFGRPPLVEPELHPQEQLLRNGESLTIDARKSIPYFPPGLLRVIALISLPSSYDYQNPDHPSIRFNCKYVLARHTPPQDIESYCLATYNDGDSDQMQRLEAVLAFPHHVSNVLLGRRKLEVQYQGQPETDFTELMPWRHPGVEPVMQQVRSSNLSSRQHLRLRFMDDVVVITDTSQHGTRVLPGNVDT